MVRFGYSAVAVALAGLGVAAPTPLARRDVSTEELNRLALYAEYAAASYCTPNIDSTGDKLTCAEGNCPTVEAAEAITLAEFYEENEYGDVAGFLAVDTTNQLLVVSFRGSRTIDTWVANLDFGLEAVNDLCTGCEAHGGFWKAWEVVADSIASGIESALATYPDYTIVFTGHSFGGALATLGAAQLRNAGYAIELYPYGCPRVGNEALVQYITDQGSNYRVTHTNDIVPRLPPMAFGFSHISPEYWITSDTDVTPTTADIQVIEGVGSREGNAGEALQLVSPHLFYFFDITACQ
ncbi:Alpha/Beta hydrolase protein [Aspergillus undulatus]|uniref:Alpha/Beta hydrolase protein n=1 Tax=Aspergillus undulatus TaxID=1810928 RepID=UPI003CCCD2F0